MEKNSGVFVGSQQIIIPEKIKSIQSNSIKDLYSKSYVNVLTYLGLYDNTLKDEIEIEIEKEACFFRIKRISTKFDIQRIYDTFTQPFDFTLHTLFRYNFDTSSACFESPREFLELMEKMETKIQDPKQNQNQNQQQNYENGTNMIDVDKNKENKIQRILKNSGYENLTSSWQKKVFREILDFYYKNFFTCKIFEITPSRSFSITNISSQIVLNHLLKYNLKSNLRYKIKIFPIQKTILIKKIKSSNIKNDFFKNNENNFEPPKTKKQKEDYDQQNTDNYAKNI